MTSHLLKPGMLARAELEIGKGQTVLMVPKDALVLNQGSTSIYLVKNEGDKTLTRQISVTTGRSNGNWIEVTGDIEEKERVVIQGNERLRDGEEIQILNTQKRAPSQSPPSAP